MSESNTEPEVQVQKGVCPYCNREGTSYYNETIPELLLYVHDFESSSQSRQEHLGSGQGTETEDHTMDTCEVII